jgi:hypothetical protein
MLYAVLLEDNEGLGADVRRQHLPAHLSFLEKNAARIKASVLPFSHDKPQIVRTALGSSEATDPPCRSDSRQGGKGMLLLRFFQQSYREAMQPREEKATGLTTADLIRMCRATSSRDFQPSQNEGEDHSADRNS